MSIPSAQPGGAGHALAQRIDRFLAALERVRRNPNRREAYHVIEALRCLQDGLHEQGEEAMGRAERVAPLPAAVAAQLGGPHDSMTTRELRTGLEALKRAARRTKE